MSDLRKTDELRKLNLCAQEVRATLDLATQALRKFGERFKNNEGVQPEGISCPKSQVILRHPGGEIVIKGVGVPLIQTMEGEEEILSFPGVANAEIIGSEKYPKMVIIKFENDKYVEIEGDSVASLKELLSIEYFKGMYFLQILRK